MNKALTLLAGALLVPFLSSQAWADDEAAAKSVNAVGVVKYTIPAGGELVCVNLPLYPMLSASTHHEATKWYWPETSLAQQLPNTTVVYFWDGTSWASSTKGSRGWSNLGATKTLGLDEAFFIKSPVNSTADIVVSLLGELPTDATQTCDVEGGGALVTRGVTMYPVETKFSTSSMATSLPNSSIVYFWDGTSWASSTKGSRGWSNLGGTITNFIGEGIFVKSAQTKEVEISRPFDWD